MKIKLSQNYDPKRAAAFQFENVSTYFNTLKHVLSQHDLYDKPDNIFNMDEKPFRLDFNNRRVLATKSDVPKRISHGKEKETVTTVFCVNASGRILPPLIVHKAKKIDVEWCDEAPEDWEFACSDSGFITAQIMENWFKDIFLPNIDTSTSNLLILDGHKSHIQLNLLELAEQHNVILLFLPSSCSDHLQPLDLSYFSDLTKRWYKELVSVPIAKNLSKKKFHANFVVVG